MNEEPQCQPSMRKVLETVISEIVDKGIYWPEAVAEFEKLFIMEVLRKNKGNVSKAAQTMGIHRNTLSKKMREFGICRGRKGEFQVDSSPVRQVG